MLIGKISKRNKAIAGQLIVTILFKTLSFGVNFLVIPVTISCVSKVEYGVWVTLLSMFSWITLLDVGIGNGLRNALTMALVNNDVVKAKQLISTAYLLLIILSISLSIPAALCINIVNWQSVLNVNIDNGILIKVSSVFIAGLLLLFVINIITQILNSFQKSGYNTSINLIANLLFIVILVTNKAYFDTLLSILSTYVCCSLFSYIMTTVVFFFYHQLYIPGLKFIQFGLAKDILRLGVSFFLLQIAVLVIFTLDNYLILKFLGPTYSTTYNIAFKIFTIPTILFSMIMIPFWAAFTEAYAKRDFLWIRKRFDQFNLLMIAVIIALACISYSYEVLIKLWLGKNYASGMISSFLKFCLSLFVFISIWNNVYSFYLNGISKVKVQLVTAVFGLVINIPLAYLFSVVLKMGLAGIVLAMCASLISFSIIGPIYSYKTLKSNEDFI